MCRGVLVLVFVEHYSRILMASASGMFWWRKTSAGGSSPTARPLLSTAWNSMCTYAQCIVHDHFYHKLAIVVCARMHSAQFHFYQQRAKVHVRSSTACACSANVRVCTHTSTHASTWGFYVFAVWPCSPPPVYVWEQRQIVYAELILNKRRRLVKPSQIILPSQEFSN